MSATRRQMALEIVRIVVVVALALLLGFFITALVSDDPVGAYTEFLTGPLPKVSINDDGSWQLRGVNRFGNWIEDSIKSLATLMPARYSRNETHVIAAETAD